MTVASRLPSRHPRSVRTAETVFRKLDAVRTEIADVVVRKALPNVAEGRRAEQRIHDCVGQDVGVRVPVQSFFKGNFNAAEDELSPIHKAGERRSRVQFSSLVPPRDDRLGQLKVERRGDLDVLL